jgi:anthranilate synthase component 1
MTQISTTARPDNQEAALAALREGKPALVWRRVIADSETPVGAGAKLIESGRGDFLLESVQGGEVRARYSLLGLDPDLVFRAVGKTAEINRIWQHDRAAFEPLAKDPLTELRALVAACHIDVPAALPRRWPVWSAISVTRPLVWSRTCPARRRAISTCPICSSCARASFWSSTG